MKRLFSTKKTLVYERINKNIKDAQYAVRGELAIKAEQLKDTLEKTPGSLPFDKITSCNIGNPQQLGQKPISFFRQVLSLVDNPEMLESPFVDKMFPSDAISRAKTLLKAVGGSTGAYSHSQGIPLIRKNVAKFIEQRDGFPSDPDSIFLTAGASPGVQVVLQTLIEHSKVGIMIPIPQYPLYTASIALYGGQFCPYYLDEQNEWGLSIKELEKSLKVARSKGLDVRALCVINPGNPTGQCLSPENISEIIQFCSRENLVILADEVYQSNCYSEKPFVSFKKVLSQLGSDAELISFHSVSKGMVGECGRRGGYFECVNIDKRVVDELYKICSISLCPPVDGQVMVDLMVNPPKPNDPSYTNYKSQVDSIYESLKRRAAKLANAFNQLERVSCNPAQGAMYLFPTIDLPQKAIKEAQKQGKPADAFYCMELLKATGVCLVPGSGFGQKQGTLHFRCTFLPPEDSIDQFIERISVFHSEFLIKYSD